MLIKYCMLCATAGKNYFCEPCYQTLPWNQHSCLKCALPLSKNETICGQCITHPPNYSSTVSLFRYDSPIDYLITHFKYHQQLAYGKILSQLLIKKLKVHYQTHAKPQAIIPIPLHPRRLIERGFNQALELAKPIAKTLAIPLDYRSAQRIRHTVKQSELALKQRAPNVHNAFSIAPQNLTHVAVVDDVMTTGHTMQEFCYCLTQAGISKIDVWCIARTDLN